jgi:DNA-binding MarR family transcriptional regulator
MTTGSEIPIALRVAYLALHRRSEARFAPHGVTADQFVLLATLARGHALTQRELARRMSSDPSTVRAMLVLLEQRGLVGRDTHPTDARADGRPHGGGGADVSAALGGG